MLTLQTEKTGSVKDLITAIAQSLVDNPGSVSVGEVTSGQTMVLELRVAMEDMGKVIGRQGRTAHVLRTIYNCRRCKG